MDDKGAFVRATRETVQKTVESYNRNASRILYGDGLGLLALGNAVGAAVTGGGTVGTLAVAVTVPVTTGSTFVRGGSVSRSGDTTQALAITLTSGNTTNLIVPAAVTIAAGESIASFTVSGGVIAGSTTITATALGMTAVATVNVVP